MSVSHTIWYNSCVIWQYATLFGTLVICQYAALFGTIIVPYDISVPAYLVQSLHDACAPTYLVHLIYHTSMLACLVQPFYCISVPANWIQQCSMPAFFLFFAHVSYIAPHISLPVYMVQITMLK